MFLFIAFDFNFSLTLNTQFKVSIKMFLPLSLTSSSLCFVSCETRLVFCNASLSPTGNKQTNKNQTTFIRDFGKRSRHCLAWVTVAEIQIIPAGTLEGGIKDELTFQITLIILAGLLSLSTMSNCHTTYPQSFPSFYFVSSILSFFNRFSFYLPQHAGTY